MTDNVVPFPMHRRRPGSPPSARRPRPDQPATYRLHVALAGIRPEIWREVEVDSTLPLDRLHPIIQLAMGWRDNHLHEWLPRLPELGATQIERFVLPLPDGEKWVHDSDESEVHLDELLQQVGDRLWYNYDFGDGWLHRIELVATRPGTPPSARAVAGENACPPENIGGPIAYQQMLDLAANPHAAADEWWREDFARRWPDGVIDQRIDLCRINEALAISPTSVLEAAQPWRRGARADVVAFIDRVAFDPRWSETVAMFEQVRAAARPVDPAMAASATEPIRWLLEYVGEGLTLTSAKWLKPADVVAIAQAWGLEHEWIGKLNRENDLLPLFESREALQRLGLLREAKGRLTRTKAAEKAMADPVTLWNFLAAKVPGRARDFEREASFAYLLAVGVEEPEPEELAAQIMGSIGWHVGGKPLSGADLSHGTRTLGALLFRLGSWEEQRTFRQFAVTETTVAFARNVLAGDGVGRG